MMNVVDSSGWLAYFADEPSAGHFSSILQDYPNLVVPVIVVYEVFRVILREAGENNAMQAYGALCRGSIVEITPSIAMTAAKISMQYRLPMADSMILAVSRLRKAVLWTQDKDFQGIPGVKYFLKTK